MNNRGHGVNGEDMHIITLIYGFHQGLAKVKIAINGAVASVAAIRKVWTAGLLVSICNEGERVKRYKQM